MFKHTHLGLRGFLFAVIVIVMHLTSNAIIDFVSYIRGPAIWHT